MTVLPYAIWLPSVGELISTVGDTGLVTVNTRTDVTVTELFVAERSTLNSPTTLAVPVIKPVSVSSVKPLGKPVSAKETGASVTSVLVVIW